jgi:hypothetical protein
MFSWPHYRQNVWESLHHRISESGGLKLVLALVGLWTTASHTRSVQVLTFPEALTKWWEARIHTGLTEPLLPQYFQLWENFLEQCQITFLCASFCKVYNGIPREGEFKDYVSKWKNRLKPRSVWPNLVVFLGRQSLHHLLIILSNDVSFVTSTDSIVEATLMYMNWNVSWHVP